MSSDKKTFVVFGATGLQGGSVVDAILGDEKASSVFKIRAITRDTTKPTAVALAERGVELAKADLDDRDSLRKAFKDAYAVFVVTNFLEHSDPERETKQGINAAEVAAEVGVQHFIFSGLPNITKLSKGKHDQVRHFDSKAAVETHIRTNLAHLPSTFFLAGAYMSNYSGIFSIALFPYDPSTKTYSLTIPFFGDIPAFPILDVQRDTGKFIKAILLKKEETLWKQVFGATKYASAVELVQGFNNVFESDGVKAKVVILDEKAWKERIPEPYREPLSQGVGMLGTVGYYGGESLDWSLSILDEQPTTWDEFVRKEKGWAHLQQ